MSDWLDSRRLIGPNIEWPRPGALLEVAGNGDDFESRLARWTRCAQDLMKRLEWAGEDTRIRRYPGGALLILSAPVDVLYTATEVAEQAWLLSRTEPSQPDLESAAAALRKARDEEADPGALNLWVRARALAKTCLIDEYGVSLGTGVHGRHFPPGAALSPDEVAWEDIDDVPAALVTGTNGKTTTVRLLAAMARAAGHTVALSSTDWIQVGDEVLDEGDYSGPGGARQVLRDPRTELAILETARGGLLRRGLALDRARVAVVTNIAEDHLGDGGILTVDDLAEVKFMVTRVLGETGIAVLNADDPRCRSHGSQLPGPVAWFSLSPPGDHGRPGDRHYWLEAGQMKRRIHEDVSDIAPVGDLPIALGGGAMHNVANALAAAAAAEAMGVPLASIRQALARFGASIEDNPGRANLVDIGGVRVLLDFAHNPEGMKAILGAGQHLNSPRMAVVFGQAGDRTDAAVRDLTRSVVEAGADYVVIKEMAEYRRGREPGEIPALIRQQLLDSGVSEDAIAQADTETEAATLAYQWAKPGDLLMLFVHAEREAVMARLYELGHKALADPSF